MNDLTDDEISQALAMAARNYEVRFGEAALVFCLTDLIEMIEAQYGEPVEVIPQSCGRVSRP